MDYEPLTQAMIDQAAAAKRRIELAGTPPRRLPVEECHGINVAWEKVQRPGRPAILVSVLPEGQPARIV